MFFLICLVGSEIGNKQFQSFCLQENIRLIFNQTTYKASFVERFQRTLQGLIYKWCTDNQTYTFYHRIQDFVQEYNNKKHRMICTGNVSSEKTFHSLVI